MTHMSVWVLVLMQWGVLGIGIVLSELHVRAHADRERLRPNADRDRATGGESGSRVIPRPSGTRGS